MTFYPSSFSNASFDKSDKLVTTISMLGATLIGVGALLAVGANWDFIPQLVKVSAVVMATLSAYAAGWYMKTSSGGKPRLGEALTFLGAMMYGVGIWLIMQIFGYDTNYAWGILLWALGIIPVAVVARSGFIAVLACSLLNYWLLLEPYSILNCAIWAALSFGLAYFVRSPWALAKSLVGAVVWSMEHAHLGCGSLVFLSLAMVVNYFLHVNTRNFALMSKPYLYIGSFFTLLSLLFLTDERGRVLFAEVTDQNALFVVVALLVVSLLAALKFWRKVLPEVLGCAVIAVSTFGLSFIDDTILRSALSNGLLMLTILGFVGVATLRIRDNVINVMSSMFFTIAVSLLYFDSKFSMSDRSLFLLTGGGLMLVFASGAERLIRFGKIWNDDKKFATRKI